MFSTNLKINVKSDTYRRSHLIYCKTCSTIGDERKKKNKAQLIEKEPMRNLSRTSEIVIELLTIIFRSRFLKLCCLFIE